MNVGDLSILLYTPEEQQLWERELSAALPSAQIHPIAQIHPTAEAPQCHYALLWRPPPGLLATQHNLRAIFALGAGVDSILTAGDLPSSVPLVRIEDAGMAQQMVEYSLYAVLHTFRGFGRYHDDQTRRQWAPRPAGEHRNFPVGVLGLGVLGRAVAQGLAALDFPVHGWSRTRARLPGVTCHSGPEGLRNTLTASNVLIVLLPLTHQTRGLLDAETLSLLPDGACLVNLARGPLVVEQDLLDALDRGPLAHAFLDVFSTEPLPPDHPFWHHRAVSVTPHVAALTPVAPAAQQIAQKILQLQQGLPVTGIVDPTRGY